MPNRIQRQYDAYPYNTAYIVCPSRNHQFTPRKPSDKRLTVEDKLIPTELMRTSNGLVTSTKTMEKNAVMSVVMANERRRPSALSTRYAPSYVRASSYAVVRAKRKRRTSAPGHPPNVKMTMSHRLASRDFESPVDAVSNNFG